MISVFSITTPIFLIILIGYTATRKGLIEKDGIRSLGIFVIQFALPALIFRSLSQRSFTEIIDPSYLLAYGCGSLAMFVGMFSYARLVLHRSIAASSMQALGSSASNSGFIGYPIAMIVAGPAAGVALALTMMVENILIIPLALVVAESDRHQDKTVWRLAIPLANRMARNPLIIAILLGMAASLSGLQLPGPLLKSIDMLAMASGAVALFAVGGALVGLTIRGMLADMSRIVAGKLILHPLVIVLVSLLLPPMAPDLRKAMIVLASGPMLSIYPLLGQNFGQEQVCAATLILATVLSFLTVSGVLMAL